MSTNSITPLQGSRGLRIALIGYGKMGRTIEGIVLQRGHDVNLKIDIDSMASFTKENLQNCDVAIEFTGPHSAKMYRCRHSYCEWQHWLAGRLEGSGKTLHRKGWNAFIRQQFQCWCKPVF